MTRPMTPTRLFVTMATVATLMVVTACAADGDSAAADPTIETSAAPSGEPAVESSAPESSATEPELSGTITVAAAASLTEAFTVIGEDFSAKYPDVEVVFTFDSSSSLAEQVLAGAPVDVFASADEANMTKLTDAGAAATPTVFATNSLVVITQPGNPGGITGLADLATAGIVSLCGVEVPCGRFAAQALETAGVVIPETSVTRGQNVKATLTAVAEGDAVAGIVYLTDAQAAGATVATVDIPLAQNVVATYPIASVITPDAEPNEAADAFVDYVTGEEGQKVLAGAGFAPPN